MRLSCLLMVLIVQEISAAQSHKVLKFGNTVGDYIRFKPNMQPFSEAFSLCSWIRKSRSGSQAHWFSYATRSNYNEIVITDEGSSNYVFDSYSTNVRAQAGVTAGVWYHYCLCWSLSSRTATIYHNGRQTGSFTTPSGRRLTAGGYLVLGQDQDTYGGSFDSSQSFGGELDKTNIFSKKLTSSEVSELYSAGRCSDVESKYDDVRQLKWEQILQQPRTGNVRAEIDTCRVEQLEEQLEDARKELTDTKASKEEISDQLNRSEINLNNTSSELEQVRAYLEQTTGQLTETETQLNQTETRLDQTETRLNQTETQLNQTETQLNQTETQLDQTEKKLDQTETRLNKTEKHMEEVEANLAVTVSQLNQTEKNLEETRNDLNETLAEVEELEEEVKEIKKGLSGFNCFRVTNSTHWDILYTESFFDEILTEDMLAILDESWEKLEYFKGTRVTERLIEFFKRYFP
ncbi:uncharacterized protein LOC134814465 [Bolinopsis microptera]|uniref:uncharacterized protein LOC134814465 n=1 Tax=Bolinopsis microptera TaxID=2820187 RepID=UPI0030791FE1